MKESKQIVSEDGLGLEKVLSDTLAKARQRIFETQLVGLIAKRLTAHGIVPSARLKARFLRWIATNQQGTFRFRDPSGKHIDSAALAFTRKDIRNLKARVERRTVRATEKATIALVQAAPKILRPIFDKTWPAHSRRIDRQMRGFLGRLHERYAKGFGLFAMQLAISHELGDIINRQARDRLNRGQQGQMTEALTRLHGRSCQIGYEILSLLRCGHADGAMARWRTLHEVTVVALYILEKGGDIGARYIAHDAIESRKAARGYQAMAARLGHTPLSQVEVSRLNRAADAMVAKYGAEFEGDYGWAASALNIKWPKFAEIERAVHLDHFRPYYKLASHNVHANPKGILQSLGIPDSRSMLASGPSNVGLTDPAQNAALSLFQVTTALATYFPTLESLSVVAVLTNLPAEIGRTFWKIEKMISADERRLRRAERRK